MENRDLKIEWVNSFKGIAMCAVVFGHVSGRYDWTEPINKFTSAGARGVQLFLIISALLAFISYNNNTGKTHKWLLRKFVRIAPLFYFSILLYLIILGMGPRYALGSLEGISAANILANIVFLNGLNPYWINSTIGVNWYIADLALFWLLTPFLAKKITDFRSVILCIIGSLIFGNGLSYALTLFNPLPSSDYYLWKNYLFFWLPNQLSILALGILLYIIKKNKVIDKIHTNLAPVLLFLGIAIIIAAILSNSIVTSNIFVYGLGFLLIILSQDIKQTPFLVNKIFDKIGNRSYGIYLLHMLILTGYEKLIGIGKYTYLCFFIECLAIMIISYLLALASNKYIELPCKNILEKLLKI